VNNRSLSFLLGGLVAIFAAFHASRVQAGQCLSEVEETVQNQIENGTVADISEIEQASNAAYDVIWPTKPE